MVRASRSGDSFKCSFLGACRSDIRWESTAFFEEGKDVSFGSAADLKKSTLFGVSGRATALYKESFIYIQAFSLLTVWLNISASSRSILA